MPQNFFKERREELKKTQRDIALAMGMTTGAVSAWETGIALPRVGLASRLAPIYEVSEGRILKEIAALDQAKTEAAATK